MTDDPELNFAGDNPDSFIMSLVTAPGRLRALPRAVLAQSDWDETALAALDRIFVSAVRLAVQRHDEHIRREVHASLAVALNLIEPRQPEFAGRLRGALSILADVIAEQQDFPVEEVLSKKHVQTILDETVAHGVVRKSELMERLGLKDANASRILSAMESASLIEREVAGREILVKPRRLGLKHASARPGNPIGLPAITRTTDKWLKVHACTHSQPASLALTFAQEMGILREFKIEVISEPLTADEHQNKQIAQHYRTHRDVDAFRVVAHAMPTDELPSQVRGQTMDIYLLGTYAGGEVLAGSGAAPMLRIFEGDTLTKRIECLGVMLQSPQAEARYLVGDAGAKRFARSIIAKLVVPDASRDRPVHPRELLTDNAIPAIDITSVPGFDELLIGFYKRRSLMRFEELEQALTGSIAIAGETTGSWSMLRNMHASDLRHMVDHWRVAVSLDATSWTAGDPASRDIAWRMYWLSSVVSETIKRNLSAFADYVANQIHGQVSLVNKGPSIETNSVFRDLERFLRIPDTDQYLKVSGTVGPGEFYWPDRDGAHGPGVFEVDDSVHQTYRAEQIDAAIRALPPISSPASGRPSRARRSDA